MTALLAIATLLIGSPDGADHLRLRITDAKTAALIAYGLERSITLRGLMAEIEAGDVIHMGVRYEDMADPQQFARRKGA